MAMTIYVCRKCGKFFNSDVLAECPFCREPIKKPKYDRRIHQQLLTMPIDSAKFLDKDALTLHISDRNSIIAGNENPTAKLGWIYYPKEDKLQLCLTVQGHFHTEKISYNQKGVGDWESRIWIRFPIEAVPRLIEFLQKNPEKLESWM